MHADDLLRSLSGNETPQACQQSHPTEGSDAGASVAAPGQRLIEHGKNNAVG